jgi:hypothetical protein
VSLSCHVPTSEGDYVISDMIDIIDLETKTPLEIKYQRSLQKSLYEHYILKMRAYLWLLNIKAS